MKKHKIKNRHLARVVDMVLSLNRLDVPVYAGCGQPMVNR